MSTHPNIPELAGTFPVVLYFGSRADADEFVALMRQAKPGLVALHLEKTQTLAEATGLREGPALELAKQLYNEGQTKLPPGVK